MPPALRWLGLALLGILIAAGVSVAASGLASQQIGLASQPISAGDALAPSTKEKSRHRRPKQHRANRDHTTTSPTPSTAPPSRSEPPTYSEPPSTTPTVPPHESTELNSHDGEHSGAADD
jgi:hypothetical protein